MKTTKKIYFSVISSQKSVTDSFSKVDLTGTPNEKRFFANRLLWPNGMLVYDKGFKALGIQTIKKADNGLFGD